MILVTGGAGFIGSNIVKGLNDRGYDKIIIADDLTDSRKHKNMNKLKFTDYIDYRDLLPVLDDLELKMIFHQGACSDTTATDGRLVMEMNYEYSKALLLYCIEQKVRFVYASSASVYGDGKKGFAEKEECEYPLNVYAFSKYQFDRFVRMNTKHFTKQVAGLRYFNVYGQQENHKDKMSSVACHMFNQYKKGESLKLFEGSDKFLRDFVHVDDVVNVNMFLMENKKVSGIFNCGTGKAESFMTVARAVKSVYKDAKLELVPFPDELKGKYQEFTEADLSALRAAGYDKDFMDVETGVAKYMKILDKTGGYII